MQVIGVDFGTTNVRIATWDSEQDLPPEPKLIGAGATTVMPAVVALRREAGGKVSIIAGEEAASGTGGPDDTVVIPNIKRLALS